MVECPFCRLGLISETPSTQADMLLNARALFLPSGLGYVRYRDIYAGSRAEYHVNIGETTFRLYQQTQKPVFLKQLS